MKEWPTRPSEMKEFLYFFSCLGPYLALAITITFGTFLVRPWLGDMPVGITAVAAPLAALLVAYLRYPNFLRRKSEILPKIRWDGRVLKFPVVSGAVKEMLITDDTQIELAYFSLWATRNTGAVRGLWLQIQNNETRAVFAGSGDFTIPAVQNVTEKSVPHTPLDQKVQTFSQVLIEIYQSLRKDAI